MKIALSSELELRAAEEILPAALHPALVYLASLAPGSRQTMAISLQLAADELTAGMCDMHSMPWHLLRAPHLEALRRWLQENRSPATANRVLAAVRGALKVAWRFELMSAEDYHRAADVQNVKVPPMDRATGRALSAGEIRSLVGVCLDDGSPTGLRDALVIVLGCYGGLRRAEIAELTMADVDLDDMQLTVRGKGRKTRVLPLADQGMVDLIQDWQYVRGSSVGPLFIRIRKGGEMIYSRLSLQAIHEIVMRRGKQAGVRKFTSHDLRRTFAGDLLDAGADIATVADLMGHANVQTTRLYDRRGARARRKAMGLRHVNYERRYG